MTRATEKKPLRNFYRYAPFLAWGGIVIVMSLFFLLVTVYKPENKDSPSPTPSIVRFLDEGKLRYVYDNRTELCFAYAASQGAGGVPQEQLFTTVPCEKVWPYLLNPPTR